MPLPCLAVPCLPLLLALALGVAANAAPTLEGVNLGNHAAGPKITAKDLRGRVVVFEYWGNGCEPCIKAIPHVAALQAKYPYQSLIIVANQSWEGSSAETAKIWADNGGGKLVAVIHRGSLPGAKMNSVPHAFVFDAAGKLVYDGHPTGMDDAVAKAVKESPAGVAAAKKAETGMARIKAVFGDTAIPDELLKLAFQASDTARSSEGSLKMLAVAAKSKNTKLADAAKAMLAAFDKQVADQFAEAEKIGADEPAKAWAAMEALTKWVPQKEEGIKAQKQFALWRRDGAFLKELAADKAWLALKAQADKIGFDKNLKAKPTSQLESDYKKMLKDKDFPGTKGLEKAKAAAPGWKLDPETGRADKFTPGTKPAPPAATGTADEKPAAEAPAEPPAETPAEPADANKSVLGD